MAFPPAAKMAGPMMGDEGLPLARPGANTGDEGLPLARPGGGMGHMINCSARDCVHNQGGKCSAPSIDVSGEAKCMTYEGGANRPPAPPAPRPGV